MAADRSTRLGLLLAISPAGAAARRRRGARRGAPPDDPGVPGGGGSAAALARLAEGEARVTPALHPVSARLGAAALGSERLESLRRGRVPRAADADLDPRRAYRRPGGARERAPRRATVPPIGEAGWFDAGPRPGEPGRAVLIGHLDTNEGPGLFARVPSLRPGTRITVLDRRGSEHDSATWSEGRRCARTASPRQPVYGYADAPVLVLIKYLRRPPSARGAATHDNVLLYARGPSCGSTRPAGPELSRTTRRAPPESGGAAPACQAVEGGATAPLDLVLGLAQHVGDSCPPPSLSRRRSVDYTNLPHADAHRIIARLRNYELLGNHVDGGNA